MTNAVVKVYTTILKYFLQFLKLEHQNAELFIGKYLNLNLDVINAGLGFDTVVDQAVPTTGNGFEGWQNNTGRTLKIRAITLTMDDYDQSQALAMSNPNETFTFEFLAQSGTEQKLLLTQDIYLPPDWKLGVITSAFANPDVANIKAIGWKI